MSKSTLNKIKDQLIQEKEHLEKELNSLAQKGKRGFRFIMSSFGSQDEEHSASVTAYDSNISLGANLEKGLEEVEKALAKIEKGEYGLCELCGQEIQPQRLEIFPAAATCINCVKTKKSSRG